MASWPIPLPAWWWTWARWRLGRGEYKPYGPSNQAVRPAEAPPRIPRWAWARLRLLLGTPLTRARPSLADTRGAFLRNPRGGVEDVAEMRTVGRLNWIALNIGDHGPVEWDMVRSRARLAGVKVIPWARVRNTPNVAALAWTALNWGSPAIGLNLEAEAKTVLPPAACATAIGAAGYAAETLTVTECWLYNAVDWHPLAELGACVLEIFPAESDAAKRPADCAAHAWEMGFRAVRPCYGTYAGQTPDLYDLTVPHSLYTADDVGAGNWESWTHR